MSQQDAAPPAGGGETVAGPETAGSSREPVTAVVEIPKGSRNKYEYDEALGAIRLDRFISASVAYPTDYGYIPDTRAPDGDPLDALICVSAPTFPGCLVLVRAVAVLRMRDEKGPDDHLVCVPCADPGWSTVRDVEDLPDQLRTEIGHFFSIYKDLDVRRHSQVGGWGDRADALATLDDARGRLAQEGA
jgi:inorganic pyrophosphatase